MKEQKMNRNVIITCAVTGSGDSAGKTPYIPVTPKEIADASIEAARAGAAIAHIHVRDPKTGKPSRNPALYREVVERIRSSDVDVIINLTTGMGGDLYLGPDSNPLALADETDLVGQLERMIHVEELLPEICTMDCGSLGAKEMGTVAQSILLGGNVRVGLEDNLYLEKGVPAANGQLVERARTIVELMGAKIQSPAEARETLGLTKR
jgi:uncharacterized protein (DUF849 family)